MKGWYCVYIICDTRSDAYIITLIFVRKLLRETKYQVTCGLPLFIFYLLQLHTNGSYMIFTSSVPILTFLHGKAYLIFLAYMPIYIYIYIYIYTYICVRVYIYIYIYIYKGWQTHTTHNYRTMYMYDLTGFSLSKLDIYIYIYIYIEWQSPSAKMEDMGKWCFNDGHLSAE